MNVTVTRIAAQDSNGPVCSIAGCQNNWTLLTVTDGISEVRRCPNHASLWIETPDEAAAFITSLLNAKTDPAIDVEDLVQVATEAVHRAGREDLYDNLIAMWDGVRMLALTDAQRMQRGKLLIGSAAFALMPSVPVPGDDDLCEAGR